MALDEVAVLVDRVDLSLGRVYRVRQQAFRLPQKKGNEESGKKKKKKKDARDGRVPTLKKKKKKLVNARSGTIPYVYDVEITECTATRA